MVSCSADLSVISKLGLRWANFGLDEVVFERRVYS
jgi:hypothetical protein